MRFVFVVLMFVNVGSAICSPLIEIYSKMSPEFDESDWHIHDPSRIIKLGDFEYLAATGKAQENGYDCGLELWKREDKEEDWYPSICLLQEKPAWIYSEMPNQDGAYWAPDFAPNGDIVYSVSAGFEETGSCVGILRRSDKNWTDIGRPITCAFDPHEKQEVEAIDPSIFEAFDGRNFLVTGGGLVHISEFDFNSYETVSGEWYEPDHDSWFEIARGPGNLDDPDWVEAAYVYPFDGFYYLFVNWGACCRGVESTYNIRVGRSSSPTGPYFDKDGVDMMEGGGSLLVEGFENKIGPGHAGLRMDEEKKYFLSFHYYDAEFDGKPWVGELEIMWKEGWPALMIPD